MAETNTLAVKRSVLRVIGFSLLSGGLYELYWFYVTRQQVDAELGDERWIKQSPAAQLFGPLVLALIGVPLSLVLIGIPLIIAAAVLGFLVIYGLYRDIALLHSKQGLGGFPAIWYVLIPLILGFIPFINFIAGLVGLVLWGVVISKLNEFWDKKTGGQATDAGYGTGEIAVVVIGILFWIASIVMLTLGVFALGHSASTTTVPSYNYSY